MFTRAEVTAQLKAFLQPQDEIIAVWEAGSAATGFLDQVSDLDISIVCEDTAVEVIFQRLEKFLQTTFGIERSYRTPEPAWHGLSQTFYQIKQVPPLFYLDIGVIKRSIKDKLMEQDRHGQAVIWFQKELVYDNTPSSVETLLARGKKFYGLATQVDFLLILEVKKAIARDQWIQSFSNYYGFIVRNLAILLNLKFRPEKVDFGLRYAHRDYPKEIVQFIEESLKVNSVVELEIKFKQVLSQYEQLKDELAGKWGK